MDSTIKVILDTDIGSDIDDAVCLAYLLAQPRCDLLGITTVSGQVVERAKLASAQCTVAGRDDIPILPGIAQPLLGPQLQPEAPQASTLDRWSHRTEFPENEAIEWMRRTIRANPGEVTLLAVGPLTNVATLDDEVARWEKMQVVLRSVPLAAPVDHYYISSGFGARVDPFNGARARHEGLDMVGTLRSDVLATAPGTVIHAGWKGNYGRVVEIDHGLGIVTLYAHLDSVAVKVGDVVDYRQVVGKLGSSGRSSGPHCHYEVRYNDKTLDPMGFLKAGRYVFKG